MAARKPFTRYNSRDPDTNRIVQDIYDKLQRAQTGVDTVTDVFSLRSSTAGGTNALSGVNTVPYSATPTFDLSKGLVQKITLTGNVTNINIINPVAGITYTFLIIQDSAGSRTFNFGGNVRGSFIVGIMPFLASVQQFFFDGSTYFAVSNGTINI